MIKDLKPQLAEAGKIKIGRKGGLITSKKGTKFQPPQKLDHFLITSNQRGEDGNLALDAEAMTHCQADPDGKIRAIPIVLHSDEIEDVFPTRYVRYDGKRAVCSGDGETNDSGGDCPCEHLEARRCKPNGILHCSIVIPGRAVAGAVHKWRTTSLISISRMYGSLKQMRELCGALRGVPLWLVVSPVQVTPGGKTTTVYCCHIECRESDVQAMQERALRAAEMRRAIAGDSGCYRALLQEPGVNEPEHEQAEVAEEFYVDAETGEVDQVAEIIAKVRSSDNINGNADLAVECADACEQHPERRAEIEGAWKTRAAELGK